MSFAEDEAVAKAAQPLQDSIYNHIFKGLIGEIIRFPKGNKRHILDREFHIDVQLKLINGITLTGQEKALRKKFSDFDTYTIEFYQDRFKKIKGEFFKLGAQFYLHGYVNGNRPEEITEFIKYYFIKIFDFLESLKKKSIEELEKNTRPTKGSRASFYFIKYDDIPKEFIYWHFENGKELIKREYFDFNISNNPKQFELFKRNK